MKEDKSTGKRLTSCICVCMCVYNTENIALYYTCISQIRASPSQHTNISDVWGYKAICITDVQPHNKIKHSLKRDQQKFTHQANLQLSIHTFILFYLDPRPAPKWAGNITEITAEHLAWLYCHCVKGKQDTPFDHRHSQVNLNETFLFLCSCIVR